MLKVFIKLGTLLIFLIQKSNSKHLKQLKVFFQLAKFTLQSSNLESSKRNIVSNENKEMMRGSCVDSTPSNLSIC